MNDRSPLSMLTTEPELTSLIRRLEEMRQRLKREPERPHKLVLSRSRLARTRTVFSRTIREGEAKLHLLSRLLATRILGPDLEITSSVIGSLPDSPERFTLTRPITVSELMSCTDLDLGSRQLERLRFQTENGWSQANLVANSVHYEGRTANPFETFKLISRIKAEQAIWNKVVDQIFDFDRLVREDKQLCHLSPFVKDIFGIKLLTSDEAAARLLQELLLSWNWDDSRLRSVGVPLNGETAAMEVLEVKDYLSESTAKTSGWTALKSVLRWWGQTFELQIQPLANYGRERERFTRESHRGFKARREQLRESLADNFPLFGFYHRLLKWLFLSPDDDPPTFRQVCIELQA